MSVKYSVDRLGDHLAKYHAFLRGPLSQWKGGSFVVDGVAYPTAEHFMMAEKARVFGDVETLGRVLEASGPAEAKALGRQVRGYVDAQWSAVRFGVVVRGNIAKFTQNKASRDVLLGTGDAVLVEVNPRDTIWGIGLGEDHPDVPHPRRWPGQNLLGFALMEVRDAVSSARGDS